MTLLAGTDVLPSAALPTVVGTGSTAAIAGGRVARVVQLNNAATTPPFARTLDAVQDFLATYGALHRGAGPRARRTCDLVERAAVSIGRFVGLPGTARMLFTTNTSQAINLLARLLALDSNDVVLTSEIEHTSNNLPWRYNTRATVLDVRADDTGALDVDDLQAKIVAHAGKVRVVAVTGASNLSGYVPDLARIAELTHGAGALFFVDAAQLAPHRPIDMVAMGIDALAFSAHKLYAPFGLGILALPSALLDRVPADPGGGSIDMISDRVVWAPPTERHQTGTWNAIGIVAAGASCETIENAGWDPLVDHEARLVEDLAGRLAGIPGLRMMVPAPRYIDDDRIGTFPFSIAGLHHGLVAAALEHEYGIEVRAGTICNHRLVRRWFGVPDAEQADIEARIAAGDRLASYGIVRASLGVHNTTEDVSQLAAALRELTDHGPRWTYRPMPEHESYELVP